MGILLAMFAGGCLAQWASITGRVTDTSGAVVAGTRISVFNVERGTRWTVGSNDAGNYLVTPLHPGEYQMLVQKEEFKPIKRSGFKLAVGQVARIDFVLQIGRVEETVTVTTESSLVDAGTASMGLVVDSRQVAELPLVHGVPLHLVQLAPGVNFTGTITFDRPYDGTAAIQYSIDGTRARRSEVTIDGIPTSTTNGGSSQVFGSYSPPADVVAEFKVQTATFDAGVGQTEGGTINVSLKSGTNNLHGTVNYVKMTPELSANLFFSNRTGQPRTDFTYNRWGTSVGGPVVLPKAYNGRNRTFFFHGYEGIRETRPRGTTLTVPTAEQREGNFSRLLALGSNYQIYDPYSRRAIAGGRYQNDPLPGNIIPGSLISPMARNILSYYPLPTASGTVDGKNNLPLPNEAEKATYYTHMGRMDHNLSDRHRVFGRGYVYKRSSSYYNWFHNATTGEFFEYLSRGAALDDVYTFSPTLVMNLRYGYDRFVRSIDGNPESRGFDLTSLGFPAAYNNAIPGAIRRFPYITITDYASTFNGLLWRPSDLHSFSASLNKVAGTHSLKFGTEYRVYRETQYNDYNVSTGAFSFGTDWTRGPYNNSTAAPMGQGLASLLYGLPTSGYVERRASYAEQSTSLALYLHDDWKLTPKLTVSLGLRYEVEGPLTERFNRAVRNFDYNAALPIEAQAKANYAQAPIPEVSPEQFQVRGGVTFAGVGGQPRTLWERDKNNLMPRLGVAYSLNDKTVIRAGYGLFYGFLGVRRGDVRQDGFTSRTNMIPSLDGGVTFNQTLADPFPDGIVEPRGASDGVMTYAGQGITFFDPRPTTAYMQRWQFSVQRELPQRIVVDVGYVGNRGTKIETARNLNSLPIQYLSRSATRDQDRINYLSAKFPNPYYPLLPNSSRASKIISRSDLLMAYPHFTAVNTTTNEGYSWYHSLQVRVEKRLSSGLTLQGSYTWSKFMEAASFQNGSSPVPVEAISNQDYPHRLAISGIYELPFGRGRRWGANMPAGVNVVLGGWQVQGIYAGQSGMALGFGNAIFNGNLKDIALPKGERTVDRWFNTAAGFERNSKLQLAQNVIEFSPRFSCVRGDGINNWDLSVIKNTAIREGIKLQLRGEFLNAFNHVMFSDPDTTPSSSAFGTITSEKSYPRRIQLGAKLIF